ncbi:serine phosphatase RsbU, regulator of sigma subunit [Paramagnetospirillum kuznetsovii]|uniref:Serine phosphatase RsbU, regulator of sigma subunit n=1 Tax=Paramagnetospirillum kuznetsovii TaxID=2053833 RepID=A0A364NWE9_9PROT|nr:SpoIIE family protein phosphatase [Paramagnetospirillum kuznetsovii]RAU21382.1 serine phosphatase RsbU, regulator of sigma subunit [Paramagnetospirillum kuznetsovii]
MTGRSRFTQGHSLAFKVFAATLPVVVAAVLATQLVVGWMNYSAQLEALTARAQLIATLTAQAISRPLWNLDKAVYRAQVSAVESDASFLMARVLDDTGQVAFQHGDDPAEGSPVIRARYPIPDPSGPGKIGEFELVLSKAELDASARRLIGIGAAAILALLLVTFATIHLATRRLIVAPLTALLDAMAKVECKNWTEVEWSSGDELGQVAAAFNRMVDGLRSGDEAKRLLKELEIAQAKLIENNAALEKASRLVLDSIGYARKIQDGLLPDAASLDGVVAKFQVRWEPLHQVGGDYYWLHPFGRKALILLADCTGHGVPGAFMTVVVATAMDRILMEGGDLLPAAILERLDKVVRERLRQDRPDGTSDDGLDAAICLWDGDERRLTFAGANMPIVVSVQGKPKVIKGSRRSLGYRTGGARDAFVDQAFQVEPDTTVYMFTDGMTDHVGGSPPRLFGRRRLVELIAESQTLPLSRQLDRIDETLSTYRGGQNRRDDMAIIAFRPY